MAHRAEISATLAVRIANISELASTNLREVTSSDVVVAILPPAEACQGAWANTPRGFAGDLLERLRALAAALALALRKGGKLLFLGEAEILPSLHAVVCESLTFHHWIVVRTHPTPSGRGALPNEHWGLAVYSKGLQTLDHASVRIAYEYCTVCGKTVKDYGGKKHLYDSYGTLMSDVWKDTVGDAPDSPQAAVLRRVRDMFSVGDNRQMLILPLGDGSSLDDLRLPKTNLTSYFPPIHQAAGKRGNEPVGMEMRSRLIEGDALAILPSLPDASVDLAFADPPYNLSKGYRGYSDHMDVDRYFGWCDAWLEQLCRVLRPRGSLVVVNTPLAAMRHFLYLQQRLTFRNWIAWDSMSMPVRRIMPSHYPLLLFTKPGPPRAAMQGEGDPGEEYLRPTPDGCCSRAPCVMDPGRRDVAGRRALTDLWTDIHRVKHNSRRADHPCQLPPRLMKRIIALLTAPGDLVLDCFNGVGTTTLCAEQLRRRYIGIEVDPEYHALALRRHALLASGRDPFAKRSDTPNAKNSIVKRVRGTRYEVPKRTLQLAVRALAGELGRVPSREELEHLGEYPIHYYDEYFRNWSEVTAATRATGMSERRPAKLQ